MQMFLFKKFIEIIVMIYTIFLSDAIYSDGAGSAGSGMSSVCSFCSSTAVERLRPNREAR
jgi:hypothetical protein